MMKVKGIFAVSLIAMMVVGGAYADIASSGYVDEKINGLAAVAKTGSYDDLADKPTIPSAYVLKAATSSALGGVKSGGDITVATSGAVTVNSATQADSATTAASATKATQDASGNVITSTYATKTELSAKQNASTAVKVAAAGTAVGDTTHPVYVNASGVATRIDKVAAAAKADTATSATSATTATTAASATKATQDADGNEITKTYATKTEVGSKLSSISGSTGGTGNVVTSVSASGSTVSATKGITAEETKNKVTSVRAAASATDTAYPSEKAVATALAGKLSTTGTAAKATADANGNNIANTYATKVQLTALDSTSSGSGAVVTNVSQTDGKVSVTKGNVQIPVGSATATTYATIWVQ